MNFEFIRLIWRVLIDTLISDLKIYIKYNEL